MSDDLDSRIRESIKGVPDDIIFHARQNWLPENIIRRILVAEHRRKIEECRTSLESCTADEVAKFQGQIKGHKDALAIINSVQPS